MRIILVQAEIELALRAYVLNQISVREGQEITIAFKNTRGDDGATAEIDISTPSDTPVKVPNTPVKRQAAPIPVEATQTASQTVCGPEVEEDTSDPSDGSPAPAVEAESDTTASEEAAPVQDASTTSEADAGNQKEEEEPVSKPASFLKPTAQPSDEAPAPSKSLFSNLTKPVNPKPE